MSTIILQSRYLQLQSDERHPRICTLSGPYKFVEEEDMSLAHCFFQLHNIPYQLHRILNYIQYLKKKKKSLVIFLKAILLMESDSNHQLWKRVECLEGYHYHMIEH